AEYFSFAADLPIARLPVGRNVKGGVRIKLRTTAGVKFDQLNLDKLPLYFSGGNEIAFKLHEFSLASPLGILVGPAEKPWSWHHFLPGEHIQPIGYSDEEALLPVTARGFQGYRLMQEYFAFPQRFLFAELSGLKNAFKRHAGEEIEIVLLFSRGDNQLEGQVDRNNFSLFCVPAINLFPKRADRIHVTENSFEYHIVPDRARPMDFEVHTVTGLTGFGVGNEFEQKFFPLYADFHMEERRHQAYYSVRREPRLLSANQKKNGSRTSYVGSEVFIALVDPKEAPFPHDLRQLSITTLCTNRDLPLLMPLNLGQTDFTLESAAPIEAIRCAKGPSKPYSPLNDGAIAWRLISHLSLNYLSLLNSDEHKGAAALRDILELYAASTDVGIKTQVEGMRSVKVKPTTRRLPMKGPITFGRGLEIELEVDDLAFQGGSAFLFGSMMEQFFARYVSMNSFTETRLRTSMRGEVMRWVPRCGERAIL
ncbi:MAG TPA: type VI secretion system baseplate subunit TssF, partial [Pseudomonadales bacterium]|nr:type VI secretion system baseplate subunit TssF [Pseudomonadales bacterium]